MDRIIRKRRSKSGEAAPPPPPASPKKPSPTSEGKKRYNFRSNKKVEEEVRWVDDDTLIVGTDEEDEEEEYEEEEEESSEEEETRMVHGISIPSDVPVSVKIHIHANAEEEAEEESEEEEDSEEEESEEDELTEKEIAQLLARTLGTQSGSRKRRSEQAFIIIDDSGGRDNKKAKKTDEPSLFLSRKEREYFEGLPRSKTKKFTELMKGVEEQIGETNIPFKFKVLEMNTSDETKANIIRKIDTMTRMGAENGEAQKLRAWVEAILRVPFGKTIPLPVTIVDGNLKCTQFIKSTQAILEKATYGMEPAKMQIMQTLAQWVSNPDSIGNCIAMQGPAGCGKTSFARNGIANALGRPFMFFSLGGASDIAHYIGHSYTYEGSIWGRIVDSIIQSKCMNPVLYFDELDKISGTPHGEEITSMLIHLTDRTQNSQYHDRYFAGIDFDLSKCLFVFSYNDPSKVNPILKDRMTVIQCSGYKDADKKIITANYVWPEILKNAGIRREDILTSEEAADYIIKEYSNNEPGMRSLIRIVETLIARINLLRMSDKESSEKYKFAVPVNFPLKLDIPTIQKLLVDYAPKESESWRSMYN
jgi:ATP-dependent Lon protease